MISKQLLIMQIIDDLLNFDFLYFVLLTVLFLFIIIYFGIKLTNKIYNLEPTSFSQSVVTPHNFSFKFLKLLGGNGQFGILLAYNYKNYVRKIENLSKLVYAVCLMFALIVFFNNMQLDIEFAYIIAQVFSALLAGFIISEMTMQGKEKLLLYRQTPFSEWNFIISKLVFYLLIILPIIVVFNLLTSFIISDFNLHEFVINLMAIIFVSISLVLISTGIFLLNPPFNEKAPEFIMNFQVILIASILTFFCLLIFIKDLSILGKDFRTFTFLDIQIIHQIILFSAGIVLLLLGKRKLTLLE